MVNLPAIVKATRVSASALAAGQRLGREIEDLQAEAARIEARIGRAKTPCDRMEAQFLPASLAGIRYAIAAKTRARRAAHTRWTNAQAVLAANPLPGDR
jgi:hypothetical protein